MDEIVNDQMVALRGGSQVFVMLPHHTMQPDAAIRHAAWLVAMADIADPGAAERFPAVLDAVRNT